MTDQPIDHAEHAIAWAGDDPRTRAIVHAILALRVAQDGAGRASNRLLPAQGPNTGPLDAEPGERRTAPHTAQHPIDRHLLPNPPEPSISLHQSGMAELVAQASWEPGQWADWQVIEKCERQVRVLDGGIWTRRRLLDDSTYTERRLVITYEPKEDQ